MARRTDEAEGTRTADVEIRATKPHLQKFAQSVSLRDPRPCPYCFVCPCDLDDMDCVEQHWPPEGGFADTHPDCEQMVQDYMREQRENSE